MKKPELTVVERAQAMGDRAKVNSWLDWINERNPEIRADVLDQCAKDPEARAYFVERHRTMGQHDKGRI